MIYEQISRARVLEELDIRDKTVITVLNKIDRVEDMAVINRLLREFDNSIAISALNKQNLEELVQRISMILFASLVYVKAAIPQSEGKLLSQIYKESSIISRDFRGEYVYLEADMPIRLKNLLDKQGLCDKL
jgi:GTP-binding protein HflX